MQVQLTITLESTDLKHVNKNLSKALRNEESFAKIVKIFKSMGVDVEVNRAKGPRSPRSPNGATTGTPHADHPSQTRRTRR